MLDLHMLNPPGVELIAELGRGAHSIVYRGRHDGHDVVVKIYRFDHELKSAFTRFTCEAATLARFDHPSIARVFDVGRVAQRPYLVREFIDGHPLSRRITREHMERDCIVKLARQLAEVLAVVHDEGLVHRNVRADNILIDNDDRLHLVDFGFAAFRGRDEWGRRDTDDMYYAAPEQTGMLHRPVDARSDLYSVGVILFEAAVGRHPFEGDNHDDILRKHASVPAPRVRSLRPDIGAGMATIINKLLAKDPDDRYQSGWSMLSDLKRLDRIDAAKRPQSLLGRRSIRPTERTSRPIAGRSRETQTLRAAHARVLSGGSHTVVLSGEPGMGRSRLLEAFRDDVLRSEGLLLQVTCTLDNPIPFSAIRSALDDLGQRIRTSERSASEAVRDSLRALIEEDGEWLRRFAPTLVTAVGAPRRGARSSSGNKAFQRRALEFLLQLARIDGRLTILIDDAQWLDDGTWDLLRHFMREGRGAPILLVLSTQVESEAASLTPQMLEDFGGLRSERIVLEGLNSSGLRELLQLELGGLTVPAELVDLVAVRSGGNPLVAVEHVRAMIEAGFLRPSWGRWHIDISDLEHLSLPSSIMELLLRRLDRLSEETREALCTAAVVGSSFDFHLVKTAFNTDDISLQTALDEALALHLIERESPSRFRFVHEAVTRALLEELSDEAVALRHAAIAEALARDESDSPDRLYALAHHAYAGRPLSDEDRVFEANVDAAKAALVDNAISQAETLIKRALEIAGDASLEIPPEVHELASAVSVRAGNLASAEAHAEAALDTMKRPEERAVIHAHLAQTHLINFHAEQAWTEARAGLRELSSHPHGAVSRMASATLTAAVHWINRLLGRRRRISKDPDDRNRRRSTARLYELSGHAAYIGMKPFRLAEIGLQAVANAEPLGPSPELARSYAGYAVMLAALRWPSASEYYITAAHEIAESLDDRALMAHAELYRGVSKHMLGEVQDAEDLCRRCLTEQAQSMDAMDFYNGCSDLGFNLLFRGYFRQGWEWMEKGRAKMESEQRQGFVYAPVFDASVFAILGKPGDAARGLQRSLKVLEKHPDDRYRWSLFLGHRIMYHLEQGELWTPIDECIRAFRALEIHPRQSLVYCRMFHIFQVYARIAQLRAASPSIADRCRERLREALIELEQVSDLKHIEVHLRVGRAAFDVLVGNASQARVHLDQAQRLADEIDSIWATYELECLRAELLDGEGNARGSQQHAQIAWDLARREGWGPRARRVSTRFGLEATTRGLTNADESSGTAGLRLRRQLDALLEVSLASASVLDPETYARAALRELVRILGAERAFLFIGDADHLELIAGQGADGESLDDQRTFSRTVVHRVARTARPLVAGSSREEEDVDSKSVLSHNLRSMIAAPLMLREEMRGVVYLDSRLARGLFTEDDTEILQSIGNHIAIALETARTAQIEAQFEAERQQRQLAEAMRALAQGLSTTLQLDEVVDGLLRHLHAVVQYEAGVVALREHGRPHLYGALENADPEAISPQVVSRLLERVDDGRKAFLTDGAELGLSHSATTERWLAVPLSEKDSIIGILVLRATNDKSLSNRDLEIASAFAGQAVTAIQNARLFGEVQRLATTDELTGTFNRRNFFQMALNEFERAKRYERPLTTLILDLDHFKDINDTHGHAVGDRLLRAVADICSRSIRSCDILGRYGGEEFVFVLPDTPISNGGMVLAERIRKRISEIELPVGNRSIHVTASIGVTEVLADDSEFEAVLDRADRALYAAKAAGRNRVIVAEAGPDPKASMEAAARHA